MPAFNPREVIPPAYQGREQAYIKHLLLEGYLERLLYIIGWNASQLGHSEVVYVDCFAGPWQDESEDLSATSIGISLRLLSKIRNALAKAGKQVTFKAVYVENNRSAFVRLNNYLSTNSPANVPTAAIRGDFCEKIPEILMQCPSDSFAFFFIDPKGWSTVKPSILDSLLKRPRSEFLINFMFDFVNRTVSISQYQSEMAELFDQEINVEDLPEDPGAREKYILDLYRSAIVSRAKTPRYSALSGYVTILDPLKNRTKYHLIYLTRHPLGIIEFMEQSEKLSPVQDTVRTEAKINRKNENSGTIDMFGADANQPIEKMVNWNELENYWSEKIGEKILIVTQEVFAHALCDTNAFPSELQQALKNLIEQKIVINLDAASKRRKYFVDYNKKERLSRK
ncbi:MAG TPA: three-Cys-motif partner protein TcmP [Burkholderiaceae bacterium]|jgi:three-Cys-motif partner protein